VGSVGVRQALPGLLMKPMKIDDARHEAREVVRSCFLCTLGTSTLEGRWQGPYVSARVVCPLQPPPAS
jgi:hypothetical protein